MANVIIIGSGPAGISGALYTVRAGIDTTIIFKGESSLVKAGEIENYYGFVEPVPGKELLARGVSQAKRLGVSFVEEEVVGLGFEDKLTVSTDHGKYSADAVIIATGTQRNVPKINGLEHFEGSGVSYCAVCDGFFYKGKDVGVLGAGEFAVHEASELIHIAASVTLLTNGKEGPSGLPEGVKIDKRIISSVDGEQALSGITFEDGDKLFVSGLFIAQGVAGSGDLAKKIGAETNGTRIVTDEKMATNVPGLFAAGDCTGGLLQISKSVYQGAEAGTSAVKYCRSLPK